MITALDKNTALVIIDLQQSVLDRPLAHPVKGIIDNTNRLIDSFHTKGLPVVAVNVKLKDTGWMKTRKDAKAMTLPTNDDWSKLSEDLHLSDQDVYVTKHGWNAFFDTHLKDELLQRSVTGIVLCGISTSIGVEGTARAASELAFNISFATDAMTDLHVEAHERSIRYIFPRMGETGTTAEVIGMLGN